MWSFNSINGRLLLCSFFIFLFFYLFVENQKISAEGVPWTSVSNEGEKILFEKEFVNFYNDENKEFMSPSFEGKNQLDRPPHSLVENESPKKIANFFAGAVIGKDNRQRVTDTTLFPYRAIVHLSIQFNDGKVYGCTGALVSKDTVLTAGHCLYDKKLGGWATSVIATPGRNGSQAPYLPYSWRKLYSVTGWTENQNPEYDYGAVKLSGFPGNYTGWLGYRTTNNSALTNIIGAIPGYPCDKGGSESYTMWTDYGPIETVSSRVFTYKIDTYGCQSGAPLYYDYADTGYTAIAIHTRGSSSKNYGNRVTNDVFNNIKKWSE